MSEIALRKFEAQGEVASLLHHLSEFTKPLLITRDNRVEAVLLGIEQYEQLVKGPAADPTGWADLVIDRAIQESEAETFEEDALGCQRNSACFSLPTHSHQVQCSAL